MPAAAARASTTSPPTALTVPPRGPAVALLGTARNDFVLAAALALRDSGAAVTVLARRGREAPFLEAGFPVIEFHGRVSWYGFSLLAVLRRLGATHIAVVVGDQFAHANVTAALNWWRAAGLLRGADIYLTRSIQPAVLEGFNSIDQRQWLVAAVATSATVAASVVYPAIMLVGAALAGALELAARGRRRPSAMPPASESALWPVLVDDPLLGWRLRPVDITATVAAAGTASRTVRVTIDAQGQRRTGSQGTRAASPIIAFYGGSYAFGEAVSDEDTIAWRTAALLPQFPIVNRAVPGYGALQALTRLLDDLDHDALAMAIVIVDASGPAELPSSGHSRFPPSDRIALWGLLRRAVNRRRARQRTVRAARALAERSRHQHMPAVVFVKGDDRSGLAAALSRHGLRSIAIPSDSSPELAARVVAHEVAAALDHGQPR